MRMTAVPIPAAQYLRMSTDMQECSIENQALVIQRYAEANGFKVVKTYEDAGKSGLTIKDRKGLQSLLSDVLHHRAVFQVVLVYDVSRWGRFQDADEAAHYEFLCKTSGVQVHYCAEQFGPDETLPSRMMKALKRTMAAEFSRELSQRVFLGKRRVMQKGFHAGGPPGYGLRRVLVGPDGNVKRVLKHGERKNISNDHIVLAPGPAREQKWVRWIYEQRIRGLQIGDIAKELNLRNVPWVNGKPWSRYAVVKVLSKHRYMGWNCWGQTSQTLHTRRRKNPIEQWVIVKDAFKGIIDQETFDRAQREIRLRLNYKSNEVVLRDLKGLWKRRGTLSESIIEQARGMPAVSALRRRFGSMAKVYELLGFKPHPRHALSRAKTKAVVRLRAQVFAAIRECFPYEVTFTRPDHRHRYCVEFADTGKVNVVLCRSFEQEPHGLRCWNMEIRSSTRDLPALVCLLTPDNEAVEAYYMVPRIDEIAKLTLTPKDPWFQGGTRLESLARLHSALLEVKKWPPTSAVYRGGSNAYTQIVPRQARNHIHREERREAAQLRLVKRKV